jgi:hypothetical protein
MRPITTLALVLSTTGILAAGCVGPEVDQTVANTTASQSVHTFSCKTLEPMEDGSAHELSFSVVGLDAPDFDEDFVWPDDEANEDCPDCPVSVTPAESLLSSLNDNAVVLRKDGKLVLEGDADGFYWVTLSLYENSGYTKGYVRIEDGGGFVDEDYSVVHCTVTEATPPPATDLSGITGFYTNWDHEYEVNGPLRIALYPGSDDLPEGYDGYVDLAMWDGYEAATTVEHGWFKVASTDGETKLTVVGEHGEALAGGEWSVVDGNIYLEGGEMLPHNRLDPAEYIQQCYAMEVLEYEFDEGFTPEEYPMVDVSIDEDGHYEVGFGATNFDHSEADITVGEDASGNFEATVKTEWSTYVLRIPASNPRRGSVLFEDDGELKVMANIGCW